MAKFLKEKAVQAKEKQNASSCMDKLVMKKLEDNSTAPNKSQQKAKKTATENLQKKRKFIDEMLKPESTVFKEKNEREVKKHKKVVAKSELHLASLLHNSLQKRFLVAEESKMFGARSAEWAADACKSLLVEKCNMQKFLRRSPDKKKLWFSQHTRLFEDPDCDWKKGLVDQKVLSKDMALLGAVVFRGSW